VTIFKCRGKLKKDIAIYKIPHKMACEVDEEGREGRKERKGLL